MSNAQHQDDQDPRRLLVRQVAGSQYLAKSSRLRDMFNYICSRVLDEGAEDIREQEVGRAVFGRGADYDTVADNTVRVHASMLRKRVSQYFENEGIHDPLVIEIPRGNYAPVFRVREVQKPEEPAAVPVPAAIEEPIPAPPRPRHYGTWIPYALAAIFALTTVALLLSNRRLAQTAPHETLSPSLASVWSQIFPKGKQTDIVLGDASLAAIQERIDSPIGLAEYFDRSYLSHPDARVNSAQLPSDFAKALLLKRQVNYSDVALLARLTDLARGLGGDTKVRFARDYSFRELKADNSILFGNYNSDPWIEPFRRNQTLQWLYDAPTASYYPVDSKASPAEQAKLRPGGGRDAARDGYATISLLPNLNATGNVLILSATGGSATNAALDFLCDDASIAALRAQLGMNAASKDPLPYFEALIRASGRNSLPREKSILVVRRIDPAAATKTNATPIAAASPQH